MSSWSSFYVQTADEQALIAQLKSLTGISRTTVSSFPKDYYDSLLATSVLPNYLIAATTQPGWVTVVHNSTHHLADWCTRLSQTLGTQVIVTAAQNVSEYYYFALYEFGEQKRELEYCYSQDATPVNFGAAFPFEDEEPGEKILFEGNATYLFNFDSIVRYCHHFGLVIQRDYREYDWTILRKKTTDKTLKQTLSKPASPWWKFW